MFQEVKFQRSLDTVKVEKSIRLLKCKNGKLYFNVFLPTPTRRRTDIITNTCVKSMFCEVKHATINYSNGWWSL